MIRFALILGLVFAGGAARAEIDIQEVTSPGGFTAWLVEEPSIPFVSLELRFRGGASLDLPGKRGATYLMTGLLEEGAGDMDARGFTEALESLASSLDYDVGDDRLTVSAKFLTETTDETIELLRASLVSPRFDQDALDRVRAQVETGLRSDETDPDEIVGNAFNKMVFGDHPYGSAYEGTLESVAGLTREDMFDALRGAIAKDRVYVSAAGDISAEELAELMDRLLSDLPETGAAMPPQAEMTITGGTTVVPFETPQSVAIFGHAGMKRDDPDFFAAFVLNTIMGGGGFEARLMTEVREKRGLTYGIYSYLVPKDLAALYLGRVASANDRIGQAIDVIKDEWAKMAAQGVSDAELERAKTYLTGAYPLRFDGNEQIAQILVGMQMQGLGRDYVNTRNANIDAVSADDIRRVASKLMDPESLTFVVVGQPKGIETDVSQ